MSREEERDTVGLMDSCDTGEAVHEQAPTPLPPVRQDCGVCYEKKNVPLAYIIWLFFGAIGMHNLYLRRWLFLLMYWGYLMAIKNLPMDRMHEKWILLGVWWLSEGLRIPWFVRKANRIPRENVFSPIHSVRSVIDAYQAWLPLGIWGLHHLFLRNWVLAIAQMMSFGGWGLGWLFDGIRLPLLVKATNERDQNPRDTFTESRSLSTAYQCWVPFGGFVGLHHFYLRRWAFGVIYSLTFGLLGVGWLIDLVRMPFLVKNTNSGNKKSLVDAYMLWFPLGWLGLHHFYLGNYVMGFSYLFSFGGFGLFWVIDLVRMPWLVKEANEGIEREKSLCTAYQIWCMGIPGFLGFHHIYLGRYAFAMLYTHSLGLLGFGWLCDGIRMKWMVEKVNRKPPGSWQERSCLDAYILWFPLGWMFGLHHWYLLNFYRAVACLLSLNQFFLGWLIDGITLPYLVKRANSDHNLRDDDDDHTNTNDNDNDIANSTDNNEVDVPHHSTVSAEQASSSKSSSSSHREPTKKYLDDAYACWFPFGGLLGLHHAYLGNLMAAVLYFFTFGLLGFGWALDLFLLPYWVSRANKRGTARTHDDTHARHHTNNSDDSTNTTTHHYNFHNDGLHGGGFVNNSDGDHHQHYNNVSGTTTTYVYGDATVGAVVGNVEQEMVVIATVVDNDE